MAAIDIHLKAMKTGWSVWLGGFEAQGGAWIGFIARRNPEGKFVAYNNNGDPIGAYPTQAAAVTAVEEENAK